MGRIWPAGRRLPAHDIEVVTKFVFLGALITKDGLCEKEVRRRIAMGKAAMGRTNINMEGQGSGE